MNEAAERSATYEDIRTLPENLAGEILDGQLHTHPRPAPRAPRPGMLWPIPRSEQAIEAIFVTMGQLSVLRKAWHRYLLDYPGQLILSIAGIALGIAVVVSIDLAKQSALSAFVQATETISGKASYRIVGNSGPIDENLFPKLRLGSLPFRFLPKIEGYVKIDHPSHDKLRILGIDPFEEIDFGSITALNRASLSETESRKMVRILTQPGTVIVSRGTTERFNLENNNQLNIVGAGRKKTLEIAARPEFPDPLEQQAMEDLILTDIASAQEILELFGRISHIDVVARADDIDPAALQSLQQQLPGNVELIPYQRINQNARELTASFYTNLTALSLLSVLVGMFLIYNTINFLTIRRRPLIGLLRALGASRRQIVQLVISESALLGLAGTLTGLLLGSLLAIGLLDLIGNTINNAYFTLPSPRLQLSEAAFFKGLLLGTVVSILTAVPPAKEAVAVEPHQAMARSRLESNTRRQARKSMLFGLAALLAGVVTTLSSEKSVAYGFTGLMLLVSGCALLTPFFLVKLSRSVYPLGYKIFGVLGSLPVRSLNANLSRGGLAVAALMVAISATIGVGIMVTSFRNSVGEWLEQRLSADLYISAVASQTVNNGPLNEGYRVRISRLEGIRSIGSVRRRILQHTGGRDQINVVESGPEVTQGFHFIFGNANRIWKDFETTDTVIVTESYAFNHEIKQGSALNLPTDQGPKEFAVTGIYTDYNPGAGVISMSRSTYRRYWNDEGYSALSVYAEAGTDLKDLQRKLHALSDTGQVLEITERSSILQTSLSVFDQAFAITDILQWLAATIAFLGVFSVLTAIQLDRVREYGVLRAVGITSKQLAILIAAESGLMGSIAGLLAIPVGVMTALVLVYVINQRSFGWSISFHIPPETILQGLLSGIVAALLAGMIPAYRMSRLLPGDALRND
ncbi:MAG: FtsX-like permease family protein [Methylococcales bacterium]